MSDLLALGLLPLYLPHPLPFHMPHSTSQFRGQPTASGTESGNERTHDSDWFRFHLHPLCPKKQAFRLLIERRKEQTQSESLPSSLPSATFRKAIIDTRITVDPTYYIGAGIEVGGRGSRVEPALLLLSPRCYPACHASHLATLSIPQLFIGKA